MWYDGAVSFKVTHNWVTQLIIFSQDVMQNKFIGEND